MRNFFFEGRSGIGKTSLILEATEKIRRYCAGYISVKLIDSIGNIAGFQLTLPSETTKPQISLELSSNIENIFFRKKQTFINLKVFENWDYNNSAASEKPHFFIFDELGGMELLNSRATEKLTECLNSGICCIGVLKSETNSRRMAENLSLPKKYTVFYNEFREMISRNSTVFQMTEQNRAIAAQQLKNHLNNIETERKHEG